MRRALAAALLLLTAGRIFAEGAEALPAIDARSYFLLDATTGVTLAESAADEPLDPASLTKLMTAYLAFVALENGEATLEDAVPVSEKAWRATGSRMFIEVGSQVALDDLLHGLIIQSGNDAAIAIAEYLAGSQDAFVERMNETAAALGMTGTTYRNPNGLPASGHRSTTRDTAILARALIDGFPQYYPLFSERDFTYNTIPQRNRNNLLWRDSSVDGLKTGYTSAAGYCLVSSAMRDGRRVIAVLFGSKTADARTESSMALLEYGFGAFETHRLYTAGEPVAAARVVKGESDVLSLGLAEDVVITIPRGAYTSLVASAAVSGELTAPLERDQVVGSLEVRLGDELISELPLIALDAILEARMLSRVTDGFTRWFD